MYSKAQQCGSLPDAVHAFRYGPWSGPGARAVGGKQRKRTGTVRPEDDRTKDEVV